jgi:CRISPR-associated exonuclease Cas4
VTAERGDAIGAEHEPIPLSALQHAVYCLRQAALIHLERLWEENRFTAEGHVLHVAADKPGGRRVRGVRRVTALAIGSPRLGIVGVADLVEFREEGGGEPKLHRADEVQLCAQALCLEDMTGKAVPAGALFYAETKRRVEVSFDSDLRALALSTIEALRDVFASRQTPLPTQQRSRCRACSLASLCKPEVAGRAVRAWRRRMVDRMMTGESA